MHDLHDWHLASFLKKKKKKKEVRGDNLMTQLTEEKGVKSNQKTTFLFCEVEN